MVSLNDAVHLLELFHEVGLRVEAAGGIDDDDVGAGGFGGGEGIEDDGPGVGAGLMGDDADADALAPDLELIGGGGAEGVGGAEDDGGSGALERALRGGFRGRARSV
jgi:hypothetical protein